MAWQKWAITTPLVVKRHPTSPRKSQAGRQNWWVRASCRSPQHKGSVVLAAMTQLKAVANCPKSALGLIVYLQQGLWEPHPSTPSLPLWKWSQKAGILSPGWFCPPLNSWQYLERQFECNDLLQGSGGSLLLTAGKRVEARIVTKQAQATPKIINYLAQKSMMLKLRNSDVREQQLQQRRQLTH